MSRKPDLSLLDAASGHAYERLVEQRAAEVTSVDIYHENEKQKDLLTKMVCLLVANGETSEQAARKVGIAEKEVVRIISSTQGMDLVVRFQSDSNPDLLSRVKKLANVALDVQTRLLLSPNTSDSVKARVANEVIDRAHGRATQVTETRNLNFDLKSADALDKALEAQQAKLTRIEETQKRLAVPVSSRAMFSVMAPPQEILDAIKRS